MSERLQAPVPAAEHAAAPGPQGQEQGISPDQMDLFVNTGNGDATSLSVNPEALPPGPVMTSETLQPAHTAGHSPEGPSSLSALLEETRQRQRGRRPAAEASTASASDAIPDNVIQFPRQRQSEDSDYADLTADFDPKAETGGSVDEHSEQAIDLVDDARLMQDFDPDAQTGLDFEEHANEAIKNIEAPLTARQRVKILLGRAASSQTVQWLDARSKATFAHLEQPAPSADGPQSEGAAGQSTATPSTEIAVREPGVEYAKRDTSVVDAELVDDNTDVDPNADTAAMNLNPDQHDSEPDQGTADNDSIGLLARTKARAMDKTLDLLVKGQNGLKKAAHDALKGTASDEERKKKSRLATKAGRLSTLAVMGVAAMYIQRQGGDVNELLNPIAEVAGHADSIMDRGFEQFTADRGKATDQISTDTESAYNSIASKLNEGYDKVIDRIGDAWNRPPESITIDKDTLNLQDVAREHLKETGQEINRGSLQAEMERLRELNDLTKDEGNKLRQGTRVRVS